MAARHPTASSAYGAGPCGYGLHRHLGSKGIDCRVTAPSKMPVTATHRRHKNDTKVAVALARLHRAGELTCIWTPDEGHEAMQDLVRARRIASHQVRKARQRIGCCLSKYGRRYGRKRWGRTHRTWLADLRFAHAAQQSALQGHVIEGEQAVARRAQVDGRIEVLVPEWRSAPVVRDLAALRGASVAIASAVAAEVGDFSRFAGARQLMSSLRPRAGGILQRRDDTGARHHEGRVLGRSGLAVRGGVALPAATRSRTLAADLSGRSVPSGAGYRLEGTAEAAWSISPPDPDAPEAQPQVAVTAVAREPVGFIRAIAGNVEETAMANRLSAPPPDHHAAGGPYAGRRDRSEKIPGQESGAGRHGRIRAGRPGPSSMPHHHHGAEQDPRTRVRATVATTSVPCTRPSAKTFDVPTTYRATDRLRS